MWRSWRRRSCNNRMWMISCSRRLIIWMNRIRMRWIKWNISWSNKNLCRSRTSLWKNHRPNCSRKIKSMWSRLLSLRFSWNFWWDLVRIRMMGKVYWSKKRWMRLCCNRNKNMKICFNPKNLSILTIKKIL